MSTPSIPSWFTSTYSGGSGTECVECARTENGVLVRDSKCGEGPVIAVRGAAWASFTQALRKGEREA